MSKWFWIQVMHRFPQPEKYIMWPWSRLWLWHEDAISDACIINVCITRICLLSNKIIKACGDGLQSVEVTITGKRSSMCTYKKRDQMCFLGKGNQGRGRQVQANDHQRSHKHEVGNLIARSKGVSLHWVSSPDGFLWHLIFVDKNNIPHNITVFVLKIKLRVRISEGKTSSNSWHNICCSFFAMDTTFTNLQHYRKSFEELDKCYETPARNGRLGRGTCVYVIKLSPHPLWKSSCHYNFAISNTILWFIGKVLPLHGFALYSHYLP